MLGLCVFKHDKVAISFVLCFSSYCVRSFGFLFNIGHFIEKKALGDGQGLFSS